MKDLSRELARITKHEIKVGVPASKYDYMERKKARERKDMIEDVIAGISFGVVAAFAIMFLNKVYA